MNDIAERIIARLEARRLLLQSMLAGADGVLVKCHGPHLYYGTVRGAPALVPVEHADAYPARDLQVMHQRGIEVDASEYVPLRGALEEELRWTIPTEIAWVRECAE